MEPGYRLRGHDGLQCRDSPIRRRPVNIDAPHFGITFSAKSFMLFSVYSCGALPTEKFAISRPNPTFLAYSSSRCRTVSGLPTTA